MEEIKKPEKKLLQARISDDALSILGVVREKKKLSTRSQALEFILKEYERLSITLEVTKLKLEVEQNYSQRLEQSFNIHEILRK